MSLLELSDNTLDINGDTWTRGKIWYASNYAYKWEYESKYDFVHPWDNWVDWIEDLASVYQLKDVRLACRIFR